MPVDFYVWYRVTGEPRAAAAAVTAFMADLTRRTGTVGKLLRRRDDPLLWMEIYEAVDRAEDFEIVFASAALAHDIARFAAGGLRNVEAFVAPMGDCEMGS